MRTAALVSASLIAASAFSAQRHRPRMSAAPAAEGGDASLCICGCGVLGSMIAGQWTSAHPGATVVGETRGEGSHVLLGLLGVQPRTRAARPERGSFRHVVFCAPPSSYSDDEYADEVALAASLWDGEGAFVFTSSGGVYAEEDGGVVTEDSATSETPRAQKLLAAERAAREAGGTVLRLAGLYSLERGAHKYWVAQDTVAAAPDGLVNLVAYEDAARACVAALLAPAERALRGRTLLVADGAPRTREQICAAACRHALYANRAPGPTFDAGAGEQRRGAKGSGRVYDARATRELLGWEPEYASFDAYIDDLLKIHDRMLNPAPAAPKDFTYNSY